MARVIDAAPPRGNGSRKRTARPHVESAGTGIGQVFDGRPGQSATRAGIGGRVVQRPCLATALPERVASGASGKRGRDGWSTAQVEGVGSGAAGNGRRSANGRRRCKRASHLLAEAHVDRGGSRDGGI